MEQKRQTRTVEFRQAEDAGGRTLEGYAAVFNTPTVIDSWEGRFSEQVAPGAFKRSLTERTPILQFDHGQHPLIGSIPIGRVDAINEDTRGLYVRATISDNWLMQTVRDAINDGGVTGMSFQFAVREGGDEWNETRTERTLTDIELYEMGPVVWPAYEDTSVGVRSELAEMFRSADARADFGRMLAALDLTCAGTGEGRDGSPWIGDTDLAESADTTTSDTDRRIRVRRKARAARLRLDR